MSQLVCPLCGRLVGVEYFDPKPFEDDIYSVDVSDLGRCREFEVVGRYSVLARAYSIVCMWLNYTRAARKCIDVEIT